MDQVIESTNLAALSDEELDVLERQIAGKYMGKVPWGAVIWGIGNCLIFIALFPLVLSGLVPLWAGFIVATLNVILAYLPSHEAQHNIIAGRGKPLRWLNELVGHMSVIPMVYPYRICAPPIWSITSTPTTPRKTVISTSTRDHRQTFSVRR